MRLVRRVGGGVGLLAIVIAAACGRDFDALFADGSRVDGGSSDGAPGTDGASGTDASGSGDAASDGGPSVKDSGGSDAGDSGFVCPQQCTNMSGADASAWETVCDGCCNCGTQTCLGSDSVKRCEGSCTNGAECTVDSQVAGVATLTCDACKTSSLTCEPNATECTTTCAAGASCTQTCKGGGPCTMSCPAGAKCDLTCSATSSTCDLSCAGGTKVDCGNHRFVCGKQCS